MGRINSRAGSGGGGGLSAEQEAVLAKLAVSSGRIIASVPVIHKPVSVSDWSSLPAGWFPLSPPIASTGLTKDTNIVYAEGGATLFCGDSRNYLFGAAGYQGTPCGWMCPIDPRVREIDLTLTVDSFDWHGRMNGANQFACVGVTILSSPLGLNGGYASARIWYSQYQDPAFYFARLDTRRPGHDTTVNSSGATVSTSSADPGEQQIRLKLTESLRVAQGYWGETELTGGSISSGGYDWTRTGMNDNWESPGTGPLYLLIEAGTDQNPYGTPLPSVRVTGLTVA